MPKAIKLPLELPLDQPDEAPNQVAVNEVQTLSFEAAVSALDAMVAQLESDDLPLEQAMQTFERSQALIRHCQQQLSGAEAKVQLLVRALEADGFGYELSNFEDDEDEDDEVDEDEDI